MSPAQAHRERLAAQIAAGTGPQPQIASYGSGGQPVPAAPDITPASGHRIAQALVARRADEDADQQGGARIDPAAAQIMLRLRHDKRRLKAIQSIERKIDAKREMLPEYRGWCDQLLEAGRMTAGNVIGSCGADDVLPTIMVWCIDTGDWPRALELAGHVIRFNLAMPSQYERVATSLITEEVAEQALKLQARGETFPLDVLEDVDVLTGHADMHDEIRAKLMKAIGIEQDRAARLAAEAGAPALPLMCKALASLQRAGELHGRVGVKDRVKRLEKAIVAASTPQAPTGDLSLSTGVGGSDAQAAAPAVNAAPADAVTAMPGNDATKQEN